LSVGVEFFAFCEGRVKVCPLGTLKITKN